MRSRLPLALLAVLVLAVGCSGSDDGLGLVRVDRPLPPLGGATVQGGEVTPADYAGKVTVVNVFASWCAPCREEQPGLERVWMQYRDRGVAFVGINYRDGHAQAQSWIDEFDVTYPVIEDPAGGWADDLGFYGLPDTYLVDATGTIRYQFTVAAEEQQVAGLLDELLATTGS